MKSYASVEKKEWDAIRCEVEMIPVEESKPENFETKETEACEIYMGDFDFDFEEVKEGDILVVEHEYGDVRGIYGKDDFEKQRRIEIIEQLKSQI